MPISQCHLLLPAYMFKFTHTMVDCLCLKDVSGVKHVYVYFRKKPSLSGRTSAAGRRCSTPLPPRWRVWHEQRHPGCRHPAVSVICLYCIGPGVPMPALEPHCPVLNATRTTTTTKQQLDFVWIVYGCEIPAMPSQWPHRTRTTLLGSLLLCCTGHGHRCYTGVWCVYVCNVVL